MAMPSRVLVLCALLLAGLPALTGCRRQSADRSDTVRFLIESSPTNLDLRQGTDAQAERVGALLYDALVRKDEHFNLQPWLATSWQRPDPQTWVFHLRDGVHFHDGKLLTADDVAWSIRSMSDGTLVTAKGGAFALVDRVEVTAPLTVTVHTREPDAGLLFNLSDGLFGVVEQGAGRDEGLHPIGTGPFRFVSQAQDRDVVMERFAGCWAAAPRLARIRFDVVPDNITTALELKKGSADVESNAITLDEVYALRNVPGLRTETSPGSVVLYANFNVTDPQLRDPRIRQAIAYALNRPELIDAIWRGGAQPAASLLPPGHWARAADSELPLYAHDPRQAIALLDAAGLHADAHGIRLRFTLKTSTDETTRLLAQSVQQQLAEVGIAVEIRSAEFGTFYADITKGAFQMYILRWIGANEDPDIFRNAYSSARFPPKGSNRGHFASAQVDSLLTQAAAETDQAVRRGEYVEVQKILAEQLPSIPLWYPNTEIVHSDRLVHVHADAGGTFQWLREAELR